MAASAWRPAEPSPGWKVAATTVVLIGLALNAYASGMSRQVYASIED